MTVPEAVSTGAWWATSHTTPDAATGVTMPSSPRADTAHTIVTSTPIARSPITAAHSAAVTAATGSVPTTSWRVRRGARVTRGGVEGRSSIDVTSRCSHPAVAASAERHG